MGHKRLREVIPGDGRDDRVNARVCRAEHERERAPVGGPDDADDRVAVSRLDLRAAGQHIDESFRVGYLVVEGVEGDPSAGTTESACGVGHYDVALAAHPFGIFRERTLGSAESVGKKHRRGGAGCRWQVQVDVQADGRSRSRCRWHCDAKGLRRSRYFSD